jgi:hypothetical protein
MHSRSSSTPTALLTTNQDPLDSESTKTGTHLRPRTAPPMSMAHGGNKNITTFHNFYGAPSQQDRRLQRKRNKGDPVSCFFFGGGLNLCHWHSPFRICGEPPPHIWVVRDPLKYGKSRSRPFEKKELMNCAPVPCGCLPVPIQFRKPKKKKQFVTSCAYSRLPHLPTTPPPPPPISLRCAESP